MLLNNRRTLAKNAFDSIIRVYRNTYSHSCVNFLTVLVITNILDLLCVYAYRLQLLNIYTFNVGRSENITDNATKKS